MKRSKKSPVSGCRSMVGLYILAGKWPPLFSCETSNRVCQDITWETTLKQKGWNPKVITVRDLIPTCQSLGFRVSHVTFGSEMADPGKSRWHSYHVLASYDPCINLPFWGRLAMYFDHGATSQPFFEKDVPPSVAPRLRGRASPTDAVFHVGSPGEKWLEDNPGRWKNPGIVKITISFTTYLIKINILLVFYAFLYE